MKYIFTFAFILILNCIKGQNLSINNDHGFYFYIPNNLTFDIREFELDATSDLIYEKGAYYVKDGHDFVKLTFTHRADKKKYKFSYPVNKPKITGIYLGKIATGSECTLKDINKYDLLRIKFDVDSIVGNNWFKITGFTEQLLTSKTFNVMDSKNGDRHFDINTLDTTEIPQFYSLENISIQTRENILLPQSVNFFVRFVTLNSSAFSNPIYNWYSILDWVYPEKTYSEIRIKNKEIDNPIILQKQSLGDSAYILSRTVFNSTFEFFTTVSDKNILTYKAWIVDSLNASVVKYHDEKPQEKTDLNGLNLKLTRYLGNGYTLEYHLQSTHKDFLLAGSVALPQTWTNDTKMLGKAGELIQNQLAIWKSMNLKADSVLVMYKGKTLAIVRLDLQKANPCGNIDCTSTTLFYQYHLPEGIVIKEPKKLKKLNAKLAKVPIDPGK